jgi:hypothetical protein
MTTMFDMRATLIAIATMIVAGTVAEITAAGNRLSTVAL